MKMKKNNQSGFVLAETLIVTVFLMLIFTMIYNNFYPLIGEYEKREVYNDVDGIYSTYWIKKLIEDSSYSIEGQTQKIQNLENRGYVRFECSDIKGNEDKKNLCVTLVKSLEVAGCSKQGDLCEIYITKYQIGNEEAETNDTKWFKNEVKTDTRSAYEEYCTETQDECTAKYVKACAGNLSNPPQTLLMKCTDKAKKKIMNDSLKDYVNFLPDYSAESLNYAKYRVIVMYHHKKDNNSYYSFATMEVNK